MFHIFFRLYDDNAFSSYITLCNINNEPAINMCLWTADDLWLCSESLIKLCPGLSLARGDPSLDALLACSLARLAIVSLLNFNELSIFNRGNDGERRNKLKTFSLSPRNWLMAFLALFFLLIVAFRGIWAVRSQKERYAHEFVMILLSGMMIRWS